MSMPARAHELPLAGKVLVIAHRGASALRPEHTLAAYRRAIADGADFIEPDLVMTRDGVLVARHENEIGSTTDVAGHPEFAARRTRKIVDGQAVSGWFSEDFTLAELAAHAYTRSAPVEIQSFEVGNLRHLRGRLGGLRSSNRHPNVRLLQLLGDPAERPWDVAAAGGDEPTYARMMTPAGLREVAGYADAIGPHIRAIVPLDAHGRFGPPTALVRDTHAAGLEVHPYTFRPENHFLPKSLWQGSDPGMCNEAGAIADIRAGLAAGIDAFFTDAPAIGRKAVDGHDPCG